MDRFRLHVGDEKDFCITRESFKENTRESKIYVRKNSAGEKQAYAICPGCNNPIQLVGIYRKIEGNIRPYGKHCLEDVPGLASYDGYEYSHCHFASHSYGKCPKEQRNEVLGDYERKIYKTMRQYFDKVVYVLQETTGICVSNEIAYQMLRDYVDGRAYMFKQHTIGNMPWMLMYLSDYPYNPYKKRVAKGSELHRRLEKIDGVYFQEVSEKYDILMTSRYTEISVIMLSYARNRGTNGQEDEKMKISIAHRYCGYNPDGGDEWIQDGSHFLKLDTDYLSNLIGSKNAMKYRNEELLRIAGELMPSLGTATE